MFKIQLPKEEDPKIAEEREEYWSELRLFEEYELPVFLNELSEFASLDDVWSAIHYCNQFGYQGGPGWQGWTPIEIARKLYDMSTVENARYIVTHLFQNYRSDEHDEQRYWLDESQEIEDEIYT